MKFSQDQEFIRGDLLQKSCDHIFWNNEHPCANMDFNGGAIVFCKIDEVLNFFEKLRLTRRRIILVTGEGDFPCDVWRQQFLPSNVAYWFATNVTHPHPRVCALPLGFGTPQDDVTLDVAAVTSSQKEIISRDQWLYVNFRPETNCVVRQPVCDYFQSLAEQEPWITFEKPEEKNAKGHFLKQLKQHHFVLAPPGNGVDTHRLWETLLAGSYPIVLRSAAMEPFFDLPILFVDDYKKLTLDFLKESLHSLERKKTNLSMLQMSFWEEKIQQAKKDLQQKKYLTWSEWLSESMCYRAGMIKQRISRRCFFRIPENTKTRPFSESLVLEKENALDRKRAIEVRGYSKNYFSTKSKKFTYCVQDLVVTNKLKDCCDHVFWSNEQRFEGHNFHGGDIVFCKIDEVLKLFEKIRLTRKKIILVTGEGCLPCDYFKQQFLPANIVTWFATNVTHSHPKVCALPLGLGTESDAVTLNASAFFAIQEENISKNQWLYVNFRPETNHEERQKIYHYFKSLSQKETWITFEKPEVKGSNKNYLKQLKQHHFVLAPPGRGIDTHRLWETLLAGSYPIVLRSAAMEPFSDLPILFIKDVQEITFDFLKENRSQLEEKEKNFSMLQMSFWEEKIRDAKKDLQQKKYLTWSEWLSESLRYGVEIIKRRFL